MHKTTPSVDCNYWLKRLDIQLNQSTNKNSIKVPRVVEPKIRKRYYKHFNVPSLMHIPSNLCLSNLPFFVLI